MAANPRGTASPRSRAARGESAPTRRWLAGRSSDDLVTVGIDDCERPVLCCSFRECRPEALLIGGEEGGPLGIAIRIEHGFDQPLAALQLLHDLRSELVTARRACRVELSHPLARDEGRAVLLAPDVLGKPQEADDDRKDWPGRGWRASNDIRAIRKYDGDRPALFDGPRHRHRSIGRIGRDQHGPVRIALVARGIDSDFAQEVEGGIGAGRVFAAS